MERALTAGSTNSNANVVIEGAIRDLAGSLGIFDIPPGKMNIMLDAALSKVKGLGPGALAKLSSGSSFLTDAAQVGFAAAYGGMSETQRQEQREQQRAGTTAVASVPGKFGEFGGRSVANVPLAMRDDEGGRGTRDRAAHAALTRDAPLSATGAVGFARELGIGQGYAGFFVGASAEMRDALRGSIRNGTAMTDSHVKNMHDVSAVIGAVRAGKLKPDDPRIPPSVKQIMKDMSGKGIDPATAKPEQIKKYLKEHPGALEGAKREVRADRAAAKNLSDDKIVDSLETQATAKAAGAPQAAKRQAGKKPTAPTISGTL